MNKILPMLVFVILLGACDQGPKDPPATELSRTKEPAKVIPPTEAEISAY